MLYSHRSGRHIKSKRFSPPIDVIWSLSSRFASVFMSGTSNIFRKRPFARSENNSLGLLGCWLSSLMIVVLDGVVTRCSIAAFYKCFVYTHSANLQGHVLWKKESKNKGILLWLARLMEMLPCFKEIWLRWKACVHSMSSLWKSSCGGGDDVILSNNLWPHFFKVSYSKNAWAMFEN